YQPTTLWTMNVDGTAVKQIGSSDNTEGFALSPKENWAIYGQDSHLWMVNLESGREEPVTFGEDHESFPKWLANGDVLYHYSVGSLTALRLLVHIHPADIPGLGLPTPAKVP
ncbi:MAG: hypothetical protein Q7O66_06010, partial [Dehalococcoidia bacterium]|nr:hypothetical protein [Dehalococcoidia bacterium]